MRSTLFRDRREDEVYIVSRSPRGLTTIRKVVTEVCCAFALAPPRKYSNYVHFSFLTYTADDDIISRISPGNLQTSAFLHLLGGAFIEFPIISTAIVKWVRVCLVRVKKVLFHQSTVTLSYMDAVRGPLATTTTYTKPRTVHHWVLLRTIVAQRNRPDSQRETNKTRKAGTVRVSVGRLTQH